jgi:DNA-binding GntR family transcriptional regulator
MSQSLRLSRPPTLTRMAVDQIRNAIVSGQFPPGRRLVEIELSESFGISRAPLREAFRILAGEGLIEIRRNRGFTVINPSVEELEKMVLIRAIVEGTAARLITARADAAALDRLTLLHQDMAAARGLKTNVPFLESYWSFHRSLVELSDNDLLVQSWNAITAMFRIFMSKSSAHFANKREILHTTKGFVRCFRAGEAEVAERVVRSMIVWMGYVLLDARIPPEIAGYVTHVIAPDLNVVAMDGAELEARVRRESVSPSARKQPRARSKFEHAGTAKRAG